MPKAATPRRSARRVTACRAPCNKKGSSPKSGEGSADLEEEVGVIAVAIGDALDDLDPVVDAFEQAGMHGPTHPTEDSAPVGSQAFGEVHQRRDFAFVGLRVPLPPCLAPAPGG